MAGINFSQYAEIEKLLRQSNLEHKKEHIRWTTMSREEAATILAEMHLMCQAGLTNNLELRKRSKNAANFYYGYVNNKTHGFVTEQAIKDMKMDREGVSKLFAHRSFLNQDNRQYTLY